MDSSDKIIRGSYGAAVPEFGYAGPPVEVHEARQFKGQCHFSAICWLFSVLSSLENSESAKENDLELAVFSLHLSFRRKVFNRLFPHPGNVGQRG